MARANDVKPLAPQTEGWNQITNARSSHTPSIADGVALAQGAYDTGGVAAASPGAVLGTGMNTDRYTPVLEAV